MKACRNCLMTLSLDDTSDKYVNKTGVIKLNVIKLMNFDDNSLCLVLYYVDKFMIRMTNFRRLQYLFNELLYFFLLLVFGKLREKNNLTSKFYQTKQFRDDNLLD